MQRQKPYFPPLRRVVEHLVRCTNSFYKHPAGEPLSQGPALLLSFSPQSDRSSTQIFHHLHLFWIEDQTSLYTSSFKHFHL